MDISDELAEVIVVIDRLAGESVLEKVTHTVVFAVVDDHIAVLQTLHQFADCELSLLDEEMQMVVEYAVGIVGAVVSVHDVTLLVAFALHVTECPQHCIEIVLVMKYVLAVDTSEHHMVDAGL